MRGLIFIALMALCLGCSGVATKEEVTCFYKHHNLSKTEYNRAKEKFTEEEQKAIETRYNALEKLFRMVLEYDKE